MDVGEPGRRRSGRVTGVIRRAKNQSAMEYLMTYGWSILIIAIVLTTLFSLNVFGSVNVNSCIPDIGFLCRNLIYNAHLSGFPPLQLITINFSSTSSWNSALFAVVPVGQSITYSDSNSLSPDQSDPNNFWYWYAAQCGYAGSSAMPIVASQPTTVQIYTCLPQTGNRAQIGTHISGTIWAKYNTTNPQVTNALIEVARFSIVASQS